ncbi:hypothetical protein PIB30_089153 [Stylosanthes scabra]|uniref:FAR1 domain-containing protein n=1 Tax=Stylosanthes scabra TaxID=79078 RepID=A0ABU6UVP0_9FABA|nr:hypothetical protein [Stylosanthes scabra]
MAKKKSCQNVRVPRVLSMIERELYGWVDEEIFTQPSFLGDVNEEYIPKAGMSFPTLEEAAAFYKEYAKCVRFSTEIRNTNRGKETKEIKNQLITCNREGKWISEIPYMLRR